jgi:hypothetical protein
VSHVRGGCDVKDVLAEVWLANLEGMELRIGIPASRRVDDGFVSVIPYLKGDVWRDLLVQLRDRDW